MSAVFESRLSDSPFIEIIWRGHVEEDYSPVCPADANWNLLFEKHKGKVRVTAEGATSQHVPKRQFAGVEFLVIKFKLGVFMPYLPAGELVDRDALLPNAARQSFWLNGFAWQFPDFDNVEVFVERMVRESLLERDPVVSHTAQDQPSLLSARTLRRRFMHSTGLTPKTIQQIGRAQKAATLLSKGTPLPDTAYEVGYADQPHMTRSLRRFYGQTPAQIALANQSQ